MLLNFVPDVNALAGVRGEAAADKSKPGVLNENTAKGEQTTSVLPLGSPSLVRSPMPDVDLKTTTRLNRGGRSYDPKTKRVTYKLSITNTSEDVPIPGPLRLIVRKIAPTTARITQRDGLTKTGEPYFDFLARKYLMPKQTTAPRIVAFKVPTNVTVHFDLELVLPEQDGPHALKVLPSSARLLVGTRQSLRAVGIRGDGSEEDVTSRVQWSAKDTRIVKLTSPGILLAMSWGTTEVTAKLGSLVSAPHRVTVVSKPEQPRVSGAGLSVPSATVQSKGSPVVLKALKTEISREIEENRDLDTLMDPEIGTVRLEVRRDTGTGKLTLFAVDKEGRTIGSAPVDDASRDLVFYYKVPSGLRRVVTQLAKGTTKK